MSRTERGARPFCSAGAVRGRQRTCCGYSRLVWRRWGQDPRSARAAFTAYERVPSEKERRRPPQKERNDRSVLLSDAATGRRYKKHSLHRRLRRPSLCWQLLHTPTHEVSLATDRLPATISFTLALARPAQARHPFPAALHAVK